MHFVSSHLFLSWFARIYICHPRFRNIAFDFNSAYLNDAVCFSIQSRRFNVQNCINRGKTLTWLGSTNDLQIGIEAEFSDISESKSYLSVRRRKLKLLLKLLLLSTCNYAGYLHCCLRIFECGLTIVILTSLQRLRCLSLAL